MPHDIRRFQRLAGLATVIAGPLSIVSLIVGLSGVGYDFEVFSDVSALIAAGDRAAGLIRWSFLLNLFANYLLLLPVAVLLWRWLRGRSPLFADFYTLCGLIFLLLGAASAAVSSAVWPLLIREYTGAAPTQQEALGLIFRAVSEATEGGLQSAVQNFPGAIWFWGMGALLRGVRRSLGWLSMTVGGFLAVNGVGALLLNESLSLLGLTGSLLLIPVWSVWLGIVLLREKRLAETGLAED